MASSKDIQIPVIDIANPTDELAEQLLDAAATYGFVFVELEGTNITAQDVNRMFELSKRFFASPREEKEKCTITTNNMGWSSMHSEILDPENQLRGDFKECLNFGEFVSGKAQQPVPSALVDDEAELSRFFDACRECCNRILSLFGVAFKIKEEAGGRDWLTSRHDSSKGPSGSILRLLHYPALPEGADYVPEVDIRAGAHSDYGSITLLFQRPGQEGLEILSKGWTPVPVYPPSVSTDRPPPILVNIGDILSYWTNGLLKSTVHRVIFPAKARVGGEDRYSMAFFCHPANDVLLEPVPSEVVKSRSKGRGVEAAQDQGKVITALEHLEGRLAATYGWKK